MVVNRRACQRPPGSVHRVLNTENQESLDETRLPRLNYFVPFPMAMPDWLEPMAATLTQDRFGGRDWLFERKFDGIRLLAYKNGAEVRLSRATVCRSDLPAVAAAVARLPADEVILDGEVTLGRPQRLSRFDILWLNGASVTSLPLEERRALLESCRSHRRWARRAVEDEHPWERAGARDGRA